ncbi:MAG: sigma-70 family RNA polymerase sigma factor [Clostridia bacterium]|nr:sigma-70 family RNA polymerase sigma factor [Clostridia bacterium]
MLFLYMSLIDSDENKDRFEKIYLKYRKHMKYIALKILGDEQLSEDAVHNAFLKIINHLDKFEDINCQETKNLIVIIIRSVSIDMYRKRNREFQNTDISDVEISAETDFSHLQAEEILKEVESLPEIYKDVLLLKIEYNFKDREIAQMLGISVGTVSKRLERARKQLEKQLFKGALQ